MVFRSGITTTEAPEPIVRTTAGPSSPVGASPAMILLLASWVGVLAGWLDLGLMVVNRRMVHGDFYRLGEQFVWLIPLGVAIMVLVPGMVLALMAARCAGAAPVRGRRWGCSPSSDSSTCARGYPWRCGRRSCSPRGWRSSPLGWPVAAAARPSGWCAGRLRGSSAPCWRSCWRSSAGAPGRSIGRSPPCRRPRRPRGTCC